MTSSPRTRPCRPASPGYGSRTRHVVSFLLRAQSDVITSGPVRIKDILLSLRMTYLGHSTPQHLLWWYICIKLFEIKIEVIWDMYYFNDQKRSLLTSTEQLDILWCNTLCAERTAICVVGITNYSPWIYKLSTCNFVKIDRIVSKWQPTIDLDHSDENDNVYYCGLHIKWPITSTCLPSVRLRVQIHQMIFMNNDYILFNSTWI